MKCSGDSDEYCGGIDFMTVSKTSVYYIPDSVKGCFKDTEDRVMNAASTRSDSMTVEVGSETRNDRSVR